MGNATASVKYYLQLAWSFLISCGLWVSVAPAYAETQGIPLQIIQMSTLSFGTFSMERSGGGVAVDAKSGGCLPKSAVMVRNLCSYGQIEIRGQPEAQLLVEMLPQGVSGSGAVLRNMNFYPNNNGIITLGLDGKAMVNIGGELVATSVHGSPDISATYMLNVNYLY